MRMVVHKLSAACRKKGQWCGWKRTSAELGRLPGFPFPTITCTTTRRRRISRAATLRLDLYWIPLGAGDRSGQAIVRFCGRIFETIGALLARRPRCQLFHAALVAESTEGTVYVEVAPVPDARGRVTRGVVAEGAVGTRWLASLRTFRYEVRCWAGGTIPDLAYAVESPLRLTDDPILVERVLQVLPDVPTPTWGRDELDTGDMWNSNSVVSWALTQVGLDGSAGTPPLKGRAPGWSAGVEVAHRAQEATSSPRPEEG